MQSEGATCEKCGHVSENRGMDCIYSTPKGLLCPDCMYEALLAERRPDDDEPVTQKWWDDDVRPVAPGAADLQDWPDIELPGWIEQRLMHGTKGDVRRFFASLGVDLVEGELEAS